jgi:uncharacterized protein (DUF58 family)
VTFPLVPRGRLIGLSFGTMRSFRRGTGSDVVDSRPYRRGDDVHSIDWAASARRSAALQSDEFIVREHYADEAPRVVIACDRRPGMSCYPSPLPWLDKPRAARETAELLMRSAVGAGGFVGYLDHADGTPYWEPPRGGRRPREVMEKRFAAAPFTAPPDSLERALAHLAEHRRVVTSGAFVFVLSDFLPPPSDETWLQVLEHRWDFVPVVIQDPTWEQSFPDVHGLAVPLRDPRTGRVAPVRLTASEAAERRDANERRYAGLLEVFRGLDLDPVLVSSSDPSAILSSFLGWSEARRTRQVVRA